MSQIELRPGLADVPVAESAVSFIDAYERLSANVGVLYDRTGIIQGWNVKTGQRLDFAQSPLSRILAVGFPGNNRVVALSKFAGSLCWWDTAVDEKDSPFQGHLAAITALAFTGEGESIVTVGSDERLLWWNTRTGAEERSLHLYDRNIEKGEYPRSTTLEHLQTSRNYET